MRSLLTFVTSLLCYLSSPCQSSITTDVVPFKIGDSISTYRKLIKCSEPEWNGKEFVQIERPNCSQFKYLPAETEPLTISKVKFSEVVLISNESGKIKMVMFLKLYRKTDSTNPKKLYTKDQGLMTALMNSFSKSEPLVIKCNTRKEETYVQREYTWWVTGKRYDLQFTAFKGRVKAKGLLYSLSYSVSDETSS